MYSEKSPVKKPPFLTSKFGILILIYLKLNFVGFCLKLFVGAKSLYFIWGQSAKFIVLYKFISASFRSTKSSSWLFAYFISVVWSSEAATTSESSNFLNSSTASTSPSNVQLSMLIPSSITKLDLLDSYLFSFPYRLRTLMYRSPFQLCSKSDTAVFSCVQPRTRKVKVLRTSLRTFDFEWACQSNRRSCFLPLWSQSKDLINESKLP